MCSIYVIEEIIIITQKWMSENQDHYFYENSGTFSPLWIIKEQNKKEKKAVWSMGVAFAILIKAQLHKTYKQAF